MPIPRGPRRYGSPIDTPALIPRPAELTVEPGRFGLHGPLGWNLTVSGDGPVGRSCESVLIDFADRLRSRPGPLRLDREGERALAVTIDPGLDERFSLETTDESARIVAGGPEALLHALETLWQLSTGPGEPGLWRVRINDRPAFAWRGAHLDVARHFFSVEDVERFIDLLALHRLNVLHLHVSDDQGFRLDLPRFPRLAEVAAWRDSSPLGHQSEGRDDHVIHGGCYSPDDVARIVAYAARRRVTVVPEIDLPGHVQALLAAYPELANTDERLRVATRWGISTHVLNLEESTLEFMEGLLEEVAALFPSPYLHLGGDECPLEEWAASASARTRLAELDLDLESAQSLFARRLVPFVERLEHRESGPTGEDRRRALLWDEALGAGAPREAIIVAWRHSSEGLRAARAGHRVVMAPMQFTYFDWPQSASPDEPVALTRPPIPTSLDKVLRFEVIPPGLEPELHHLVLGAQAQHWSEYIASREHLEYMALPRLAAFAERVWGSPRTDLAEFTGRLDPHLARLGAMGYRFRPLEPVSPPA